MNRRSFLARILKAGAAPMFLPSALYYARRWAAPAPGRAIWVIDWEDIQVRPSGDIVSFVVNPRVYKLYSLIDVGPETTITSSIGGPSIPPSS